MNHYDEQDVALPDAGHEHVGLGDRWKPFHPALTVVKYQVLLSRHDDSGRFVRPDPLRRFNVRIEPSPSRIEIRIPAPDVELHRGAVPNKCDEYQDCGGPHRREKL